jgi:hypothetical protein
MLTKAMGLDLVGHGDIAATIPVGRQVRQKGRQILRLDSHFHILGVYAGLLEPITVYRWR